MPFRDKYSPDSPDSDSPLTFESLQRTISEFREKYPRDDRRDDRLDASLFAFSSPYSLPLCTSPYLPTSPAITPALRYPRLSKLFRRFRLWLERLVDNADLAIEYPFTRVKHNSGVMPKLVDPEYAYLFNSFGLFGRQMVVCRPEAAVRINSIMQA